MTLSGYRIHLQSIQEHAACPDCGESGNRVHSLYQRTPCDLPVSGRRVMLLVTVRKFFCDNKRCLKRIFCERLGGVIGVYARRTLRLTGALTHLALLVSANLARRITARLGLPGSARTLLRLAHDYKPPAATPVAISVDDFAFKRGHVYGTLVLDLDTGQPVEMLAEHSLRSLREYFHTQPQLTVISRDRDRRIAEAISWAAPHALQVLDLWHLLCNLSEAFERQLSKHHASYRASLTRRFQQETLADGQGEQEASATDVAAPAANSAQHARTVSPKQQRRNERFAQVHALKAAGWRNADIARELSTTWATVANYLRRGAAPDYARRQRPRSKLDPYKDYLRRRFLEGCRNAAQLAREITAQGYRGNVRTVMRCLQRWREQACPPKPTVGHSS